MGVTGELRLNVLVDDVDNVVAHFIEASCSFRSCVFELLSYFIESTSHFTSNLPELLLHLSAQTIDLTVNLCLDSRFKPFQHFLKHTHCQYFVIILHRRKTLCSASPVGQRTVRIYFVFIVAQTFHSQQRGLFLEKFCLIVAEDFYFAVDAVIAGSDGELAGTDAFDRFGNVFAGD